jgi:hypothetical protein
LGTAPCLEQEFNESSQAAENAGRREVVEVCHVRDMQAGVLMEVADQALDDSLPSGSNAPSGGRCDKIRTCDLQGHKVADCQEWSLQQTGRFTPPS